MKIDVKNIVFKAGVATILVGATTACGLVINDALIDHEEIVCPITEILNIIGLDGEVHQEERINETKIYEENYHFVDEILGDDYSLGR